MCSHSCTDRNIKAMMGIGVFLWYWNFMMLILMIDGLKPLKIASSFVSSMDSWLFLFGHLKKKTAEQQHLLFHWLCLHPWWWWSRSLAFAQKLWICFLPPVGEDVTLPVSRVWWKETVKGSMCYWAWRSVALTSLPRIIVNSDPLDLVLEQILICKNVLYQIWVLKELQHRKSRLPLCSRGDFLCWSPSVILICFLLCWVTVDTVVVLPSTGVDLVLLLPIWITCHNIWCLHVFI